MGWGCIHAHRLKSWQAKSIRGNRDRRNKGEDCAKKPKRPNIVEGWKMHTIAAHTERHCQVSGIVHRNICAQNVQ